MSRAAVLIGVNRTGGLPALQDAANSARRMEQWARAQGVEHVKVFTDEAGATVDVGAIKTAIRELNELGSVEQLIVFFAGHGINVNRGERWLLTDAPADPQAAVNLPGSAELARFGGIPYVVTISDSCRTAAEGIQAQGVTGSEIFPNEEIAELELPVDQFFACRLGRPSHEIRDANTTTREYTAIYTRALVSALEGTDPAVLDEEGYVRPRPLKKFLQQDLARRLRDLELETKLIQVPDAHIASDERAWLSCLADAAGRDVGDRPSNGDRALGRGVASTVGAVLGAMLNPILADSLDDFSDTVRQTRESDEPGIVDLGTSVETAASTFGPTQYETRCGFKVRGAHVLDAVAGAVDVEHLSEDLVRIHPGEERGGNVLLVLDGGVGLALPAIPEFIAAVTAEDGEVVDVAYEPSEGTERWGEFTDRAREVRALRAVAASSSREGSFELEGEDALQVARRMQYAKGVDPALAIYAAYAYADHGRRDLIRQMYAYMVGDLGAALFDVALLARERDGGHRGGVDGLLGFAPLLAQGWALLSGSRVAVPPSLRGLERHVLPGSLWTVYDTVGVDLIRQAIAAQEIR